MAYGGPAAGSATATPTNSFGGNSPIYIGQQEETAQHPYGPAQAPEFGTTTQNIPLFKSFNQLNFDLRQMPVGGSQIRNWQKVMYQAGYLSKGDLSGSFDAQSQNAYTNLLNEVWSYNQSGVMISPDELLARRMRALAAFGGPGGRGSTTSTSTSVDLADPITAGALIDRTLQNYQGRGATQAERQAFTQALNAYQKAHPTTTTTTSGPEGSSSVTNSAQVDPSAFAQQYATTGKQGVETNTHTVANDYYKAALSVLGVGGR